MLNCHPSSHEALMRLKDSGRVSGVLLLNSGSDRRPASYSDDAACPNSASSYKPEQCSRGVVLGDSLTCHFPRLVNMRL